MQKHSWPGNVRELANVVAYTLSLCESDVIQPNDLPENFMKKSKKVHPAGNTFQIPIQSSYREAVEHFERAYFSAMVEKFPENISALAKALEIDRSTLYGKLDKYQIALPNRSKPVSLTEN
jgi:DNA-binding NtrC family response regulator